MKFRVARLVVIAITALAGVSQTAATSSKAAEQPTGPLLVFGAASLTEVLGEIAKEYTAQTGQPVKVSFASSSILARQIESGASVDAFVSADAEWMDYLQARTLIDTGSRFDIVGNRLALIAPLDSKLNLRIAPGFKLAAALGDAGRLATGDPDVVPVGRYARSALQSLGAWSEVKDRLVPAENVRAALAFVARGEAPLGIVYETDARVEKRVRVVNIFPSNSHPPIVYPAAATAHARPGARRFVEFLRSPPARAAFEEAGFIPLSTNQADERASMRRGRRLLP